MGGLGGRPLGEVSPEVVVVGLPVTGPCLQGQHVAQESSGSGRACPIAEAMEEARSVWVFAVLTLFWETDPEMRKVLPSVRAGTRTQNQPCCLCRPSVPLPPPSNRLILLLFLTSSSFPRLLLGGQCFPACPRPAGPCPLPEPKRERHPLRAVQLLPVQQGWPQPGHPGRLRACQRGSLGQRCLEYDWIPWPPVAPG